MLRRLAETNASMSGTAGSFMSANSFPNSPKSAIDLGGNAMQKLLVLVRFGNREDVRRLDRENQGHPPIKPTRQKPAAQKVTKPTRRAM
jgi:endonuclease IV